VNPPRDDLRHLLLDCYRAGLGAVDGRMRVRAALDHRPFTPPVALIALGKAAAAMAHGALDAWGAGIDRGLVVSKTDHIPASLLRDPRLHCLESSHPVPDVRSLEAGEALLAFIEQTPPDAGFLVLISGGTSSLVEALPEGISLEDLERLNRWLLGSGLAIDQMNAIRKGVSRIKGGRLARYFGDRPVCVLLLSDVPGNDPATIGSGLVFAGAPQPNLGAAPKWVGRMLAAAPPWPGTSTANIRWELVGSLAEAMDAVAGSAAARGLTVVRHPEFLEGDAQAAGERLAEILLSGAPGVHVWGGETTVRLPAHPGRGGRCQHLALAAARRLAGRAGVALLAAGTDGGDGPTADAGALVDGGTLERGQVGGYDADDCLSRADAGSFLQAAGDLIQSGPTGTNVMDLMIGVRRDAGRE